jgi:hypothetical protein
MSSITKKSAVEFSVPVSDGEKERAVALKDRIHDFCDRIKKFKDFFDAFFTSLEQISSGKDLIPIGATLKRYQYKLRSHFNNCVKTLSLVLVSYRSLYSESRTDQIRDVMMNTFSEARLKFIELMSLMDDFDSDNFIAGAKENYQQINNYMEKVLASCQEEWISHIDKNILGKLKLASSFSLVRTTK